MKYRFRQTWTGKQVLQVVRREPVWYGQFVEWEYFWRDATRHEADTLYIEIARLQRNENQS